MHNGRISRRSNVTATDNGHTAVILEPLFNSKCQVERDGATLGATLIASEHHVPALVPASKLVFVPFALEGFE